MSQKLHRLRTALVRAMALTCLFGSAGALAFDYGEFRSGMTRETVKSIGARHGFEWHEMGSPDRVYLLRHTSAGGSELGYMLNFCDGRLGWISVPLKPDNFATLVDTLVQLTAQLGSPTVQAESETVKQTDLKDGRESRVRARTITFSFPLHGAERQELVVNGDSDTAFSSARWFRDTSICPR